MSRSLGAVGAIAASVPLLLSGFYLYHLHSRVSSLTNRSNGHFSSSSSKSIAPKSLPAHVASNPDDWIVHYERVVSHGTPVSNLTKPATSPSSDQDPSDLLRLYMQSCHYAFSRTPQAFMLALVITNPEARRTFSGEYIRSLEFHPGQRVNGAYTVVYVGAGYSEGSERVELALDPPQGYRGPTPQGRIISEILPSKCLDNDRDEDRVTFVNETWMWRKANEPKTLLEGRFGSWIHALTSGWLVLQGQKAVQKSS